MSVSEIGHSLVDDRSSNTNATSSAPTMIYGKNLDETIDDYWSEVGTPRSKNLVEFLDSIET